MSDARTTAEQIIRLLTERRQTLAVAESCTGGLIAHLLTEVPGSSEAFLGGAIVYANALKEKVGVPAEVLDKHGAVSAETAVHLAIGVREWTGADYGLAVTGIAGPGGATETKPVGLTYVAVATESEAEVEEHIFRGDRSANKMSAARAALDMLESKISNVRPSPSVTPLFKDPDSG